MKNRANEIDFREVVNSWYLQNKRDLPWRRSSDPYRIWLSEIILQQTRIDQGLPYYLRFIKTFPTVFDLAEASEQQVLKLWQGLGYYSRARNLHYTAKEVAYEMEGIFPKSFSELKKLKGVGEYTASAIASICYGEAVAVVDGNVYRVLSRYFGVDTPINATEGIRYFKELATRVLDLEHPGDYNQAIMEFGAMQCKPQLPLCASCGLQISCVAFQLQRVDKLPVKLKKNKIKKRYFNYIVLLDHQHTLLQARTKKDIWQHLYQFPLVESNDNLSLDELTKKEDFLDLISGKSYDIRLFNPKVSVHKLSHQHIYTQFWIVELKEPIPNGIHRKNIREYPVPVLIANFVKDFGL
ncbi:A/G-specific adenine glycosylase [Galbibacter marinus]|uniref:Adenine DNA glycosylase n=1 Tax=Galbibacter marinus TaxID=555500 RepID=K2QNV2_9FLAO|nr:A/G-specific adenine glycosylase [Galbibacter marinus]EKF56607.1 A/G-specific adenine glycosylase [Galbibacter marinus]